MRGSYLVTGASTGIGHAVVAELVRRGTHVWAGVRRDDDAQRLRDEHGDAVSPLRFDVTDHDSVRAAGKEVSAAGPLTGLVNNAGAALPGPLEHLPIEAFTRQLDVNLVGQLAVTQAMLPALRASRDAGGDARIVMIGSIGGRVAGPTLGAYHAAKFGLVGLTDSLRAELAPFGIRVLLIEPGSISTPIWKRGTAAADDLVGAMPAEASRYADQIEAAKANAARLDASGLPPSTAARVVVDTLAAANPRPRQVIGRDAKSVAVAVRLLPHRLLYRMTASRR